MRLGLTHILGPELFTAESTHSGPGGVAPHLTPQTVTKRQGLKGLASIAVDSEIAQREAVSTRHYPTIGHGVSYERAYKCEIGSGRCACQVRERNI